MRVTEKLRDLQGPVFAGSAGEFPGRKPSRTRKFEPQSIRQAFPTPSGVVRTLMEEARIQPGEIALEPSAGHGALTIAMALRGATVDAVELYEMNARFIRTTGSTRAIQVYDFLKMIPDAAYDLVVMNPPSTCGADVQHVVHALRFLKPGGRLVAVMSDEVLPGGRRAAFRDLVDELGGTIVELPEDAFAECGGNVRTAMVSLKLERPVSGRDLARLLSTVD